MPSITLQFHPYVGQPYQHGYHLGTQEALAYVIAEEKFFLRPSVKAVSLHQGGVLLGTFDGIAWSE